MLSRKAVAPPWATDDFSSIVGNPADSFGKVTSRRFTSNVPLSSGSPGDFQTWTTGAHQSEEDSWKLRNQPLPELYGGLGKTSHENERISNPKVYRKATPSLDANPYEGALGPSIIESRQTSSSHARSQISALVKTPPDVWKKGKAPTIPFSGPLPGSNSATRARAHTPGHIRELKRVVSFEQDVDSIEDILPATRSDSSSLNAASVRRNSASEPRVPSKPDAQPRSKSAAPVLENYPQITADDTIQQAEHKVTLLKEQYNKLRQEATRKEQERAALLNKQEALNTEAAQVGGAELELKDFVGRLEGRIASCDEMLPELKNSRAALEEVVRRLSLVNKGLDSRLVDTRDAVRKYKQDIRDIRAASRDLDASREGATHACESLKASAELERRKRLVSLMRLQAEVEQSLQDTNRRAQELRSAQAAQEYETAEREAEEELARMRAVEDGGDVAAHLKAIRDRRHPPDEPPRLDPAVESCVDRVLRAARAANADDAARFLAGCRERQASLVALRGDLEARVAGLRQEVRADSGKLAKLRLANQAAAAGPGASPPPASAASAEREMEEAVQRSLGEIEAYAENSLAVCAAADGVLSAFDAWAGRVVAGLVRASEDEAMLRRAWGLARQRAEGYEEAAVWQGAALALVEEEACGRLEALRGIEERAAKEADEAYIRDPLAARAGPTRELASLSGTQRLLVARATAASGAMGQLSPHPGLAAAAGPPPTSSP